jgi:hypothetical protein
MAEAGHLRELIADCPKEKVIDRKSLESRLESVLEEAEEYKQRSLCSGQQSIIKGTINFWGKPVLDNYGIEAGFGAKAIEKFETILNAEAASLAASSAKEKLPTGKQYRLMITGTVRGSFGFELENRVFGDELPKGQKTYSYFEDAVNNLIDFFKSVLGTDEELAASFIETDRSVTGEITDFLKFLADSEAICGIEFGSRSFNFKTISDIQRGLNRLHKDNIIERDETISGFFVGALPTKKMFEFVTEGGTTLNGKISNSIKSPTSINGILAQTVDITVHTIQIGSSRPKYLLISYRERTPVESLQTVTIQTL